MLLETSDLLKSVKNFVTRTLIFDKFNPIRCFRWLFLAKNCFQKTFQSCYLRCKKYAAKHDVRLFFAKIGFSSHFSLTLLVLKKKDKNMIYFEDKYFIISILSLDFQKCLIKNST